MTIENERSHFYQWDLNQRLIVDEYDAGTELHFVLRHQNIYSSLRCEGFDALVVKTYAEGEHIYANIPNSLLQCPGDLLVYVFLTEGEDSHTALETSFTVAARRRPADYVYTETEVMRWTDLDARIGALEKNGTGISPVTFDLVSMGLGKLDAATGVPVRLDADMTEIRSALVNQVVRLRVSAEYRGIAFNSFSVIVGPVGDGYGDSDAILVTGIWGVGTSKMFVNFMISTDNVLATAICNDLPIVSESDNGKVLQVANGHWSAVLQSAAEEDLPAESVDLSAYESDGKIVETYADGTVKTTVVEFDADGNPVKITDGDGNVTALVW